MTLSPRCLAVFAISAFSARVRRKLTVVFTKCSSIAFLGRWEIILGESLGCLTIVLTNIITMALTFK